ncbi:MAG TPA: class I SAM-dependent methyltransferase [Anaerolineae bacterium]|nr:class I SAM-dependent methyltransferase [Anaerolineae bacterium]
MEFHFGGRGVESTLAQERQYYDTLYARAKIDEPLLSRLIPPSEEPYWNKYVGSLNGKQVLECGSGDGRVALWLATQGARVQAVELSPIGVERTRERARLHGLEDRVQAYVGDCCKLEQVIPPNSIDIALGFSVLHHFPPKEFGQSLRAVLKPGGRAIFLENSDINPLYRFLRQIRNNESACGSPLTQAKVRELVAQVGEGFPVFPRFGLFHLSAKYVFRNRAFYRRLVNRVDEIIDTIPGTRRWSAHMWVVLLKPEEV